MENIKEHTVMDSALCALMTGNEKPFRGISLQRRTSSTRRRIQNAFALPPTQAEVLECRALLSSLPALESPQAELVQIDEQLSRAQSEQNLPKGQTITVTAQAVKAIGTSAGDFIEINYNNVPEGWKINIGGETRAVLTGGSGTINVSPPGIKGKHNVDLNNLEGVSQGTISTVTVNSAIKDKNDGWIDGDSRGTKKTTIKTQSNEEIMALGVR